MPSATKMAPKMTKNQMRRAKKKELKKAEVSLHCQRYIPIADMAKVDQTPEPEAAPAPEVKVEEPVPVKADEEDISQIEISALDITEDDPNYEMFKAIVDRFGVNKEGEEEDNEKVNGDKGEIFYSDDEDVPEEE